MQVAAALWSGRYPEKNKGRGGSRIAGQNFKAEEAKQNHERGFKGAQCINSLGRENKISLCDLIMWSQGGKVKNIEVPPLWVM